MAVSERNQANPHGIFSRVAGAVGLDKAASTFDRNNAVSVLLMGALAPVAGSAISFLLGAFFVWGLISLALGRFELRMTHGDLVLAWTFTIFVTLVVLTGLRTDPPLRVAGATLWLLPFLSLWVVIPRLRASPTLDYLRLYISGAIAGCIAAFVLVGVEIVWFGGGRFEGGAGNAAIFATMCLCLAGIAGLALNAPKRGRRNLAAVAVIAGTVALVASLTRGVMLALFPILVLLVIHARSRWRAIRPGPAALLLLAVPLLALYGAREMIGDRIVFTYQELERVLDGQHTSSAGERLRLWAAAWQAFLESPLWGHGIQDRMQALRPHLAMDGAQIRAFTHPHNGYLAFAVDGGLIVLAALLALLAAPVVTAYRAPRDGAWRQRLFLALVLTTAYATVGMTQIMFKHDIVDSFYTFTAMVIAVSIPYGGAQRARAGPPPSPGAGKKSLAGRTSDTLAHLVETYLFPVFAFLVTVAGMTHAFLPQNLREGLRALTGY